jgi:outer membrane receptor for ferrienterochelin and colicins
MRRWFVVCALASTWVAGAPPWATETLWATETPDRRHGDPPALLDEVVVTGTKTAEPQWEATVPTQVVPRERIEATASVSIETVLDEIPGLYVRRNEQFALGASTIRMQGADPNKVAILIDGRRFRGGIDGVIDLRDIATTNVERVEVIRGPAASLYGSDAMAGVVNIITRSGSATPHAAATTAAGSFARRLFTASHGYEVGPVRYFLSGGHDEFRLAEQFGAVSEQFAGAHATDTQDRDHVALRLDADLGTAHRVTLSPSFQRQTNPTSRNDNLATAAEWEWQTAPGSRWTSWINRYGFARSNDLSGFEENFDYVDWEGESRYAHELGPWRWWAGNLVTAGLRGRRQSIDQRTSLVSTATGTVSQPAVAEAVWQLSPFVQADVLLGERWSFLLGSSFDVHERYGLDVNPRATLTWRPTDALRLSATAGRGFRAPDLRQLFAVDVNLGGLYALLGNPDLQPETDLAFAFDASLRARGVTGFVSVFRHEFRDLISFAAVPICRAPGVPSGCIVDPLPQLPSDLRFQTRNFDEALTQGIELGVEASLFELLGATTAHQATVGLGYGFLHTENRNGVPGEDGNALPFRPPHRVLASIGYRHPGRGISVKFWGEYEDDTFTDVANSNDLIARNHWLWSFKVSLAPLKLLPAAGGPGTLSRVAGVGRHLSFFVQGENILDTEFGTLAADGQLAGSRNIIFGIGAGL